MVTLTLTVLKSLVICKTQERAKDVFHGRSRFLFLISTEQFIYIANWLAVVFATLCLCLQ